jgi:hypothetical protein
VAENFPATKSGTMFLLLCALSFAGKLEAGWRGIPYGDAAVLQTPPTEDCKAAPEPGVAWTCRELVGPARITVSYMVDKGVYSGVYIQCKSYSDCSTLFAAISAAWVDTPFVPKSGSSGSLSDGFFNLLHARDGVCAAWTYNPYTYGGSVVVVDAVAYNRAAAIKNTEAIKASEGL